MSKKKLTAYDLLQLKDKRQLSEVFVNNVEEAAAAEEAGMDILATSYDAPQFLVLTKLPGVDPHGRFHSQRVLPQAPARGELTEQLPGILSRDHAPPPL